MRRAEGNRQVGPIGEPIIYKPSRLGKRSLQLAMGLMLATVLLLPACTGAEKPLLLTPTPEPTPASEVSPTVLCSVANRTNPYATLEMNFRIINSATPMLKIDGKVERGSVNTEPAPDGGLSATQEMVRTGLYIEIPIGTATDPSGTTRIIYINLAGCLVKVDEQVDLKDFFRKLTSPNQFQGPVQIGINRFTPTTVNPRGKDKNLYKGQSQTSFRPQGAIWRQRRSHSM